MAHTSSAFKKVPAVTLNVSDDKQAEKHTFRNTLQRSKHLQTNSDLNQTAHRDLWDILRLFFGDVWRQIPWGWMCLIRTDSRGIAAIHQALCLPLSPCVNGSPTNPFLFLNRYEMIKLALWTCVICLNATDICWAGFSDIRVSDIKCLTADLHQNHKCWCIMDTKLSGAWLEQIQIRKHTRLIIEKGASMTVYISWQLEETAGWGTWMALTCFLSAIKYSILARLLRTCRILPWTNPSVCHSW